MSLLISRDITVSSVLLSSLEITKPQLGGLSYMEMIDIL